MSVSSWIRRQFANGTITTGQLLAPLSNSALNFSLGAGQGSTFPDGSTGNFIVTIGQGGANEERVLCASRAGDNFTVAPAGRGYNGYVPVAHNATEIVLHTMDQQDLDEANQVAVATLGQVQAAGDLLVGSGPHALSRLARGANATLLQVIGGVLQWSAPGAGLSTRITTAPADGTSPAWSRADHAHDGLGLSQGLAGATQPTRYVGSTATGAPTTGTFLVGDYVVSADGHLIICTVAGSPGTWQDAGPVRSVFGRTGAVVPAVGDYLAVPNGGLSGAVAPTRYVGGTASGPPTTGTFAAGDFVVAANGHLFICTAAGTPGTWAEPTFSFPAPLSGAAPLTLFNDPYGDVWVAKGGVNGGAWRRARDVLTATAARNAAWGVTTTSSVLAFDQVTRDPYAILGPAGQTWTVPCPGWWRVRANYAATASGVGQTMAAALNHNGTVFVNAQAQSGSSTARFDVAVDYDVFCAAGDTLQALISGSTALAGLAVGLGVATTCALIEYKGTG